MCRTLLIGFVVALCLQALYRGYRVRKVFYKLRKEVCPGAAAGTMARHPLPRLRGNSVAIPLCCSCCRAVLQHRRRRRAFATPVLCRRIGGRYCEAAVGDAAPRRRNRQTVRRGGSVSESHAHSLCREMTPLPLSLARCSTAHSSP